MSTDTPTRRAIVRGGDRHMVKAYLPGNYDIVEVREDGDVVIEGRDERGWTMDGYVIPRLASGLLWAEAVDG